LAVAAVERGERGSHRRPAKRLLGAFERGRRREPLGGLDQERRDPLSAAKLVEGGVPGDPEEPSAPAAALGPEAPPLAVGALERGRRYVLRGTAVAKQRRHVGVDVVA